MFESGATAAAEGKTDETYNNLYLIEVNKCGLGRSCLRIANQIVRCAAVCTTSPEDSAAVELLLR
jgi:hypothetical protein